MGTIRIQPHDPLIVRDGRPFGAATGISTNRMYSLSWPFPSLIAGSFRTMLGKELWQTPDHVEDVFSEDHIRILKGIRMMGPFLQLDHSVYVPAPADLIWKKPVGNEDDVKAPLTLRPQPLGEGEGNDLLSDDLWPIHIGDDFKPETKPLFWNWQLVKRWILSDRNDILPTVTAFNRPDFFQGMEQDVRVHIQMNPETNLNKEEGSFFTTAGLDFSFDSSDHAIVAGFELGSSIDQQTAKKIRDRYHPMGGERRLSHWQFDFDGKSSVLPFDQKEVKAHLSNADGLRMLLLTPAQFANGWLPGWLDPNTLEGTPPGSSPSALRVKLRWAIVERWQPLSGWSLEKKTRGPKAVTRLVPAGSVYFFEIMHGDPAQLANQWFQSVTDDQQFGNDGFGIAIWGQWKINQS